MSDSSNSNINLNIYDELLTDETTCDYSSQNLENVPELNNNNLLSALYLQNNKITNLPEDFFNNLPSLMWLDFRDNLLTDIPKSIHNHPSLTHLLLQNNKLTSLPCELGSVVTLKVLQLNGNPLMFPPRDIVMAGVPNILSFLHEKYIENIFIRSQTAFSEDNVSFNDIYDNNINNDVISYNSVIDEKKLKKSNNLTIVFNEKDSDGSDDEYSMFAKFKGKCPKLAKSRYKTLPSHYQSAKYLTPTYIEINSQTEKIKRNYLKDIAIKRHKDLMATRDKILQDRKNIELLKNWRKNYRQLQSKADSSYRLDAQHFPYDTNPEFMTLLNREDIEKDLPDKYKRKLVRKCKPTVPRKSNNDVHLALKIKQLFDNLEAINLNKEGLTPRTEQKVLMNEIQKISEIKKKLTELSHTNVRSIVAD